MILAHREGFIHHVFHSNPFLFFKFKFINLAAERNRRQHAANKMRYNGFTENRMEAIMENYPLLIGGEARFREPETPVTDKFDGTILGTVSTADHQDVDDAVNRAGQAMSTMACLPAHERCRIILKAREILEERKSRISEMIAREAGKPIRYASGEVDRCLENLAFAAGEALRIHGETVPVDASTAGDGRSGYFERFPIGAVAAISPFNFPLNLAAHKIAPAVAAGCPVILKPAGVTPISGYELVRAFLEAGIPEGGISLITGPGGTVGEALVKHPGISKVSFTGSRLVGEHITRVAGLKKITMELGSNSAVVVDADCSRLDYALDRCVLGAFYNQGQVCISVQRIFVHTDVYQDFVDGFVERARKLVTGNPLDPATEVGPMISEAEAIRAESWIQEAEKQGASIQIGGKRNGVMMEPTVITDAATDMRVMRDELFAPAVVIHRVDSFEQGLQLADDSAYGLQAGVFTDNIDRAQNAIRTLNVGGVIINDIPAFRVDQMPYGGNKGSGLGREGARFAIEDMTTLKMVVFNRNR